MMKKYQFMRDGHLGKISIAKQCVILTPSDVATILTVPYRAKQRQRFFKRDEAD